MYKSQACWAQSPMNRLEFTEVLESLGQLNRRFMRPG